MITAGIDIGSMSADTVILQVNDEKDEGTIVGSSIILTGANSAETAKKTMDIALKDAGVKFEEIDFIVSTGYGRIIVPFSNKNITEISCHAKGAHWFFPSVHTIVDMGGQDCKVITCDDVGKVTSFVMNDKCAAGAGRSMTFIGELLNVPLESIGKSSFEIVQKEAAISSTCVLFARSEVMELRRNGVHVNDILAGACEGLSSRVCTLMSRAKVEEDLIISGGIALNPGVTKRIERKLGLEAKIPAEPQLVGALGAAIFAKENLLKQSREKEAINV